MIEMLSDDQMTRLKLCKTDANRSGLSEVERCNTVNVSVSLIYYCLSVWSRNVNVSVSFI